MLEQPSSSRLPWFPRWEEFVQMVQLWRVGWWMKHYGSLTPKLDVIIISFFFLLTEKGCYHIRTNNIHFSSKTNRCPGRDIEHGLTVRPLACLTAGSCGRRPAKNALSKQRPGRKPRVARFRTPGRSGSKVHSAGLNCLDLHVSFCMKGGLVKRSK